MDLASPHKVLSPARDFDPVELESLDGLHLIEASAGTGKTFNIATLFVRYIAEIEHPVLRRPLEVGDVLVVTFTEAATQELRERIRKRVIQARDLAAAYAEGTLDAAPASELLPILRITERAAGKASPKQVAERLRLAALSLDELAVFTIHGFCQRALQEHAFECGSLFQRGDIVSDSELRLEIIKDYWRRRTVNASAAEVAQLRQVFGGPDKLPPRLAPLLGGRAARVVPNIDEAAWRQAMTAAMQDAARLIAAERKTVEAQLEVLPKRRTAYKNIAANLDAVQAWLDAANPNAPPPEHLSAFGSRSLSEVQPKKGGEPPSHAFFDAVDHVADLAGQWPAAFLCGLAAHVEEECRRRKAQRRCYSYDDMIAALADAIRSDGLGERLAESLYQRYPYAMVDEFQDTDPAQYEIFRRAYDGGRRGGLMLIGDPKQAIYSFRGGDIYAYIRAAHDADQRHTLRYNYRSSPALIEAVNAVFRFGDADGEAFMHPDIRFENAADPAKSKPELLVDGEPVAAPLSCWQPLAEDDDTPIAINRLEPALINACVEEIRQWIELGRSGRAVIRSDKGERPVEPGDIAILTRSNAQAQAMKAALTRARIPSVCQQKDSVFSTVAAQEVLCLLEAAADPGHLEQLRAALATELLGYDCTQLDALLQNAEDWERTVERFRALQARWQRHGVLAMLQPLIQEAAPRLLVRADGERRITDLMHLGELLQEAAHSTFGQHGLLQWLRRQILESEQEAGDERQLRLETDEKLVQIMTIHASKGLQYGIVFAPFLCKGLSSRPEDKYAAVFHDPADPASPLIVDLGSERLEAHRRHQAREALAESIRLAYVALTRAVHRCYFAWGKIKGGESSALAWLLHREDGCDDASFAGAKGFAKLTELSHSGYAARLRALAASAGSRIEVLDLDVAAWAEVEPQPLPAQEVAAEELVPRRLQRSIHDPWWTYSFSQIAQLGRGDVEASEFARDEDLDAPAPTLDAPGPIPDRPRGAGFGNCLHAILEQLDFTAFDSEDNAELINEQCKAAGFTSAEDVALIRDIIERTVNTPLPLADSTRLRLAELPPSARSAEMEFYFPLQGTPLDSLAAALSEYPRYARTPQSLSLTRDRWQGMMTGKIDLVFEHDGRFYIVDYKSHALGSRYQDYAPEALQRIAYEQQHDLQYLIYSVALHRLLRQLLPGYDYDRHFGGVRYLFVRGLDPEREDESGVLSDRPPQALIERLDALFGYAGTDATEAA